jgi:hypothetical protein
MNASPMRMPTITLDDDAWEDLLSYIEERRVIPIVGPELLQVSTERGRREEAYVRLRGILKEANFQAPQALRRQAALLREASALVDSVPSGMRALHSVRRWHERIAG